MRCLPVRIRHPFGVWSGYGDSSPGLRCDAGAPPPDPGLGILRPLPGATPAILSPAGDKNTPPTDSISSAPLLRPIETHNPVIGTGGFFVNPANVVSGYFLGMA